MGRSALIFGGNGYDAIYSRISSAYSSVKSAKINNIWTIAYSEPREDSYKFILDFTTSEYVMYQIRFEFKDDEFIAIENSYHHESGRHCIMRINVLTAE